MSISRVVSLAGAGALALALAAPALADDTDARLQALEIKIAQQDQEIAQLRGRQDDNWLNAARAEQIKQLVRDVLSDADTRQSLLGSGLTAGHGDNGFFLASEDGKFSLQINGIVQFRYIADFRHGPITAAPTADTESGFQLARTKLDFLGNLGSPDVFYRVRLAAYRDTGAVYADTATIGFKPIDTLSLSAGRFKEQFTREEVLSDPFSSIAVDRSISNTIFTAQYVEGLQAEWQPTDWVKVVAGVNDGARSGQTPLDTGNALIPATTGMDFENSKTDLALVARADFKIAGDWKTQYNDFSSWSNAHGAMAWFVGGAIHYQAAEAGLNSTTAGEDFLLWTADTTFKTGGLSVFAAGYGHDTTKTFDGGAHYNDYALLLQAGYMVIPDKFEPFARYEYIALDGRRSTSTDPVSAVTLGANYYINKQLAKFTLDVVWLADPLTANNSGGTSFTSIGLLPDATGRSNQITVRAQLQLLF